MIVDCTEESPQDLPTGEQTYAAVWNLVAPEPDQSGVESSIDEMDQKELRNSLTEDDIARIRRVYHEFDKNKNDDLGRHGTVISKFVGFSVDRPG